MYSISGTEQLRHPHAKKKKEKEKEKNPEAVLTPFTIFKSKWAIDLKVKCKTIKDLEENKGKMIANLGFGGEFWNNKSTTHENKNL